MYNQARGGGIQQVLHFFAKVWYCRYCIDLVFTVSIAFYSWWNVTLTDHSKQVQISSLLCRLICEFSFRYWYWLIINYQYINVYHKCLMKMTKHLIWNIKPFLWHASTPPRLQQSCSFATQMELIFWHTHHITTSSSAVNRKEVPLK